MRIGYMSDLHIGDHPDADSFCFTINPAVDAQIIAGDSINGTAQIPLLKDLPFIGQLFRRNSASNKKSELMVFITPQILDPESASQTL